MSALAAALERNAARRQATKQDGDDDKQHAEVARSFLAETAPSSSSSSSLSSSTPSFLRPSSSTSSSASSSGASNPFLFSGGRSGSGNSILPSSSLAAAAAAAPSSSSSSAAATSFLSSSSSSSHNNSHLSHADSDLSLREHISNLEVELASLRMQQQEGGLSSLSRKSTVPDVDAAEILTDPDKVAQGGFSVLYKGMWRGVEVAIKKPVDPRVAMDPKLREEFNHEVSILADLRHPNILLLMAACLRPPKLCIVTEWVGGGSLFDYLHNSTGRFERAEVKNISLCIARAIYFLHTHSPPIIHRDIKTHNVLIDRAMTSAKLCDFGLATPQNQAANAKVGQGTPMYMAPELFRGEVCRLEADVYAFGVTLLEMVSRTVPFGHLAPDQIQVKVLANERPAIPLTCPRKATEIITPCWHQESSRRPKMDVVIGWLNDY